MAAGLQDRETKVVYVLVCDSMECDPSLGTHKGGRSLQEESKQCIVNIVITKVGCGEPLFVAKSAFVLSRLGWAGLGQLCFNSPLGLRAPVSRPPCSNEKTWCPA